MSQLAAIIEDLYQCFSDYPRPENFTNFEHCNECLEHNETMKSASLDNLSGLHVGTTGWSPLGFLTEEAYGHCMPRFWELALTGEKNEHGESVLSVLLTDLGISISDDRFRGYSRNQCEAVVAALEFALERHRSSVVEEFIQSDLERAIRNWKKRVRHASDT